MNKKKLERNKKGCCTYFFCPTYIPIVSEIILKVAMVVLCMGGSCSESKTTVIKRMDIIDEGETSMRVSCIEYESSASQASLVYVYWFLFLLYLSHFCCQGKFLGPV